MLEHATETATPAGQSREPFLWLQVGKALSSDSQCPTPASRTFKHCKQRRVS